MLGPAETFTVPGTNQVHQTGIEIITVLVTRLRSQEMSTGIVVQLVHAFAAATGQEDQRANTKTGQ